MPTPFPSKPFEFEGRICVPLGRGLLIRDDQMLGFCSNWHKPVLPVDVAWYSIDQVAERASVPRDQILLRIRARWSRADLIKPNYWERVVDARRNGITHDGVTRSVVEWAAHCRVIVCGLETRLARGWDMPDGLRITPTTKARIPVNDNQCPQGMRTEPDTSRGGFTGSFYFDGAVDNLRGHCEAHGIKYHTVRYRLKHGSTLAEALTAARKPRTDIGVPNPKRSPKVWNAGSL